MQVLPNNGRPRWKTRSEELASGRYLERKKRAPHTKRAVSSRLEPDTAGGKIVSAGRRAECRKSSASAASDFLSRTGEDMDSELGIKELELE